VSFILEFVRDPTTVGAVLPSGAALAEVATAVFTTFGYVHARWAPPAQRLLRMLRPRFEEVVISRTVWTNLPPALVYFCRRPYEGIAVR
jgi:phospholipid N-methyltransferase